MIERKEHPKVKALIHKLGLKYGLTDDTIRKIVYSQFKFVRDKIKELNFENMTEEEFDKAKVNFLWKYLGKYYTTYDTVDRSRVQSKTQKDNLNKRWKKSETFQEKKSEN